jgi:hypothetical protein
VRWPETIRLAIAALMLTAALAACGDSPRPSPPDPRTSGPVDMTPDLRRFDLGREPPEFAIIPPVGPRPEVAAKLAIALAMALRDHGIVATPAPATGLKRISATVATRDAGAEVQIDITWTVQDVRGERLGGNDQRVMGRPQEWFDADDRLISRIATRAAFRIGRQLGRGDIANVPIAALPDVLDVGTLPPPSDKVGPFSTGAPTPSIPMPGQPGGPATPPPGAAPPPATTTPPVLAAASNAPRVRVLPVTAPGTGSRAMTSAMRRALGESQMVLVDRAEPGAFQVQGSVELSPPVEGRQRVVIRWLIRRADGTQIGDLEQANTIRAGSLDGNWDKLAPLVALAVVDTVVDLINRDRARSAR